MKPRLLVLTSTFPRWPGDSEPGFVFDLCRVLAADFDIVVLAPHAPGAQARERLAELDVERFRYAPAAWERLAYNGGIMANLRRSPWLLLLLPGFFIALCAHIARLIRRYRPDAVHAHWIVPQGLALAWVLTGRGAPRPHAICTAHGSDVLALRGGAWRTLRRWVAGRLDRVVAVSPALAKCLAAEGCPAEKLAVASMGADLDGRFRADDTPRDDAEVVYVGRLVAGKGLEVMIEAMPAVLAAYPQVRATIIGGGPEQARLEALAAKLGLGDKIRFCGMRPQHELPEHYRRATLLVQPSRAEGFGLSVIEAMGCGCPVVASDIPALRELVRHNETGCLFAPGSSDGLALEIRRLLGDPVLRGRLAENARALATARFDWRSVGRAYVELLTPERGGRA